MESERPNAPEAEPRCTVGGNGRHDEAAELPPADAFKNAAARLGELKEYALYFVGAKLDSIKLTFRNIALYAVLGIVGGVVGLGLLVTAAVLLLSGIAGAIGAIFDPDKPWVGNLIVGLLVLAGTFGGIIFVMKKVTGTSRKRLVEKYEARKRDQRSVYGHDVQERAREQVQRKA